MHKKIKVSKDVKPIHYSLRKPFELIIGEKYYVSFGNHMAQKCVLEDVFYRDDKPFKVSVSVQLSKGVGGTNSLYAEEIGRTPEEAVINTVTS